MSRASAWFAAPRAVALAAAIVGVIAATLLGSSAWNRSGAPRTTLALTERELPIPARLVDDNDELFLPVRLGNEPPLALQLAASQRREWIARTPVAWLNEAKLRTLGFGRDLTRARADGEPRDGHEHGFVCTARRAFIALELDGDAWRSWLAEAERRLAEARSGNDPQRVADLEAQLAIDRVERSRLFAIDANLDADALERRVAGRPGIAVVHGLIGVSRSGGTLHGEVLELEPSEVHVRRALRARLAPLLPTENPWDRAWRERGGNLAWPAPVPPRYTATLAIGRSRLPYLVGVER